MLTCKECGSKTVPRFKLAEEEFIQAKKPKEAIDMRPGSVSQAVGCILCPYRQSF